MAVVHTPVALLWHEDFCRHVHVPALDRAATAQLAEAVLAPDRRRRDGRGALGADARQPPVRDHRARPSRLHHCRVRRHRRAADRRPTRRPATRAARRARRHRPRRADRGDDHGAPQRHRRARRPRTPAPHPSGVRRPPARHQHAPPGVRRARPGDDVAAPRPRDPRPAHRRRPRIRCTTSRRPRPSRRLVGQGRTGAAAGSWRLGPPRSALERDDPLGAERVGRWRGRRRGPPTPPASRPKPRYERGDGQKVLDLVAAALPAADPATADRLVDVGVRAALFKLGDPATARSFLTASGRDARAHRGRTDRDRRAHAARPRDRSS